MSSTKVKKVILNQYFEYHKNISAGGCYELIKMHTNKYYKESKKKFSLSIIETPFCERQAKGYAFSIGHKTYGRMSEIYGCVEELGNGSVIKAQIRPIFLWQLILLIWLLVIAAVIISGSGFADIVFATLIAMIPIIWCATESAALINTFEEKILNEF